MQWTELEATISTRYHHSLVALDQKVLTFGGESYNPVYMYHNSVSSLAIDATSTPSRWRWVLLVAAIWAVYAIMRIWPRRRQIEKAKL
jgi:hypothetical protein